MELSDYESELVDRIVGVVAVCVLPSQLSDQNPVCASTPSTLFPTETTMRCGKAEILLNWSTLSVRGLSHSMLVKLDAARCDAWCVTAPELWGGRCYGVESGSARCDVASGGVTVEGLSGAARSGP